jgi:hypothetical protein
MNKKIVLGLLGAFLFGCVASQMTAFVVPPARAGTAPQRWEYVCNAGRSPENITAMANAYGQEGWEMSGGAGPVLCFKRPLP